MISIYSSVRVRNEKERGGKNVQYVLKAHKCHQYGERMCNVALPP